MCGTRFSTTTRTASESKRSGRWMALPAAERRCKFRPGSRGDIPRFQGRGDGVVSIGWFNSVPHAPDAGRPGFRASEDRVPTISAPCSEAITDDSPAHPRSDARSRRRFPPRVPSGRPGRFLETGGGSPRGFERFARPLGLGESGAGLSGAVPQTSRGAGEPGVGRPVGAPRCDRCFDPSRDAGASARCRAGPGAPASPHRGGVVAHRRVHTSEPGPGHSVARGRAFGPDRFRPAILGDFQQ